MPRRIELSYMSEEEYLLADEKATVRHEYVDGHIFAMSGSTAAHNLICGNVFSVIHGHLRGGPCKAYMNEMRVRIASVRSYYYPDIMVSCEPFVANSVFNSEPLLLIEVLSPSTKQVDRREKLVAYQKIASLKEYAIVYQDRQQIEIYRRLSDLNWELLVLKGLEDLVLQSLPKGPLHVPFSSIYEGYDPPLRVKESPNPYHVEWEADDLVDV